LRVVLPALGAVGTAAVAGWLLAGGGPPSTDRVLGRPDSAALASASGAPVHVNSSPFGAEVRIDGAAYRNQKTPLDLRLEPGPHTLSLHHPDALDDERVLDVGEPGATVVADLWRRRPGVVPLRAVYPGASLLNAGFLADGQIALLVGLPPQAGAPTTSSSELWRLDPSTGRLSPVRTPGLDASATIMALSPDGEQVAYVTPGSSSALTASLWPAALSAHTALPQNSRAESVWIAPLHGSWPPRRVFDMPPTAGLGVAAAPELITGVVWTPDASRLVAITRRPGPPVRSRVFLLNVTGGGDDQPTDPSELVLLPAEVEPGSAVPDPSGRWLALVTHAPVAPGGTDLLNLCLLEIRPGGAFRDLADLGSAARGPSAAPIAWPPGGDGAPDRLAFVAPVPAVPSGGGGLFGIFNALRPAAPLTGLFVANLEASGLDSVQPRRLGPATGTLGPAWRSQNTLLGFARQDDGTLALRSIDPTAGEARDLGVRLPASVAQGAIGLSARWDLRHGRALLLARASTSGTRGASAGRGPLLAWLVSFTSSNSPSGAAH